MMHYHEKTFISSETLYAKIEEELSSYFNAGAVDNTMFPIWANYALKRLRKTALPIKQTAIAISNHKGRLPDDFDSVREAWMCSATFTDEYRSPVYRYYQEDCRITPITDSCSDCFCRQRECICKPCENGNKYLVTHKVTNVALFSYSYSFLLRPGNTHTENKCGLRCPNLSSIEVDSFSISGCDFVTTIPEGVVHLIYYSDGIDEKGNQLIPDDIYIQEYVEKYIKFKLFEKLLNSTTDETFNQMRVKYELADKLQKEAFILAEIELKKDTIDKTRRRIAKANSRFSEYAKLLNFNGYKH